MWRKETYNISHIRSLILKALRHPIIHTTCRLLICFGRNIIKYRSLVDGDGISLQNSLKTAISNEHKHHVFIIIIINIAPAFAPFNMMELKGISTFNVIVNRHSIIHFVVLYTLNHSILCSPYRLYINVISLLLLLFLLLFVHKCWCYFRLVWFCQN